tara:strand:+ start:5387 stop:5995 length:609 start_codon:yes stop_codon:yes gene_type:complete
MKNNLLTEIKHIKHLMGLNETSNEDCESQLENSDYVVFNPDEQKGRIEACEGKKQLKCVKKWMDDAGVDGNKISFDHHKGVCYLKYESDDKIKLGTQETPDIQWLFWQNGHLSHINTFSPVQIPNASKPDEKWGQYQYKGEFECGSNELKSKNMKYLGVYKVDKYGDLNKGVDFMVKKADGSDFKMVNDLVAHTETFSGSDF